MGKRSKTALARDAAEQKLMWRQYVRHMYPRFQERAYFVPPVYMNRVKYREEKFHGQTIRIPVYVPRGDSAFNHALEDRSMRDIMQYLHALLDRQVEDNVEDAEREPVVVIWQLQYEDYLKNPDYSTATITLPRPTDLRPPKDSKKKGQVSDSKKKGQASDSKNKEQTSDLKEEDQTGDPKKEEQTGDPKEKEQTSDPNLKVETGDPREKEQTSDPKEKVQTGDLKGKEQTSDPKGKEQTDDPKEKEKQSLHKGDFDILFVSKHYGLIAGEVKAVGSDFSRKTDMQQDRSVLDELDKAVGQLEKADTVLKHVVKDQQSAPPVRKALMLPYVTRSQLRRALDNDPEVRQKLCQCLEVEDPANLADVCLTADDLSYGEPPQDVMPVVVTSLRGWWKRVVAARLMSLTDDVYEDLVSRFVGPATTITVPVPWQHSRFIQDVRSVGEGVAETSRRFTSGIVLHPHQLAILKRDDPMVWLCGPPGTGKTVMLVVMASTWLSRGWHVHVISAFGNSLAASHLIAHQLQEIDRELQQQQTDQDRQQQSLHQAPQQQSEQDPQGQHSCQKPEQQHSKQNSQPPSEQKSPQQSEQKREQQSEQKRQQQSKHEPQQQSKHKSKELQEPQQPSAADQHKQRVHMFDLRGQRESAVDRLVGLAANSECPTCVVADEASDVFSLGNEFTEFCEDLRKRVPNLRLWAASLYHDRIPQGLTGFPMQVPLRTPPVVTAEVQKTDLIVSDKRVFDYDNRVDPRPLSHSRDHGGTNQSTKQATPEHGEDSAKNIMYAALPSTEGPLVIVLVHEGSNHETDKGPIDCEACGKGIADKLADLHVSKPGHFETPTKPKVSKEVKAPLTYRDVILLTTKNDISFNDDEDDDHASSGLSNIASNVGGAAKSYSGMVRGLKNAGVPVKVVKPDDAEAIKNLALKAEDQVVATSAWTVCGLEWAVVVWVKTDQRTCSDMLGRQVLENWPMDDVGGRLHAMSRTTAQLIVVAWPVAADQDNHSHCCYT